MNETGKRSSCWRASRQFEMVAGKFMFVITDDRQRGDNDFLQVFVHYSYPFLRKKPPAAAGPFPASDPRPIGADQGARGCHGGQISSFPPYSDVLDLSL